MKKKLVIASILALVVTAYFLGFLGPKSEAYCAFCNQSPCYNSMTCGYGCTCMKSGMDFQGTCVSF